MRYHYQCNLAICYTVPQPVPFTWRCVMRYHDQCNLAIYVIRYHNQCITPGNVLCGTTTSAFHLAMCHAVPRPVQPSNMSYGTTTSVFHLAMWHTVPQPVPFTWQCHAVPRPVYFTWQCVYAVPQPMFILNLLEILVMIFCPQVNCL